MLFSLNMCKVLHAGANQIQFSIYFDGLCANKEISLEAYISMNISTSCENELHTGVHKKETEK